MQRKGFFCKYTSAYFWFDVLSLKRTAFSALLFPPEVNSLRGRLSENTSLHFGQRLKKRRATAWKNTGNAWKNDGQRLEKRRATKFRATGNKILSNGQRNLEQQATGFWATGSVFFWGNNRYRKFLGQRTSKYLHKPYLYLEIASIFNLFFIHAYLYIRIGINNKFHIW